MTKISTNALGLSGLIASIILLLFKVEIDVVTIDLVITGLIALYGIITTMKNQWKRPDIAAFFLRK
jgi:hypothetical protein